MRARRRHAAEPSPRGFTLMETLVMLTLVSFAVLLMFQMLGTYRIARERFVAQSGSIDRQALFDAWFSDSVEGLHATEAVPFRGDASRFSGQTLNPLYASPGAPAPVEWSVRSGRDGEWTVHYAESGTERWRLPIGAARAVRFAYLDADGKERRRWPPEQGLQSGLPASVALVREEDGGAERLRVATVLGPLLPRDEPFQLEQE